MFQGSELHLIFVLTINQLFFRCMFKMLTLYECQNLIMFSIFMPITSWLVLIFIDSYWSSFYVFAWKHQHFLYKNWNAYCGLNYLCCLYRKEVMNVILQEFCTKRMELHLCKHYHALQNRHLQLSLSLHSQHITKKYPNWYTTSKCSIVFCALVMQGICWSFCWYLDSYVL